MKQSCSYAAVVVESPCSWILVYDSGDVSEIKSVQCRDVQAVWVPTEQGSLQGRARQHALGLQCMVIHYRSTAVRRNP